MGTARRRAYFEWTDDQIEQVGGDRFALTLNGGRHFNVFRDFPLLPPEKQREICDALCRGLSRLELLPAIALGQESVIPVRIVPRTPTETAFWADKPLDRFTLEAERFASGQGLETLHRSLTLRYQAASGWTEDLTVSLELFALLMELAEGGQILDAFSDDVFANLSVFTQRLVQEDERSLRAWNPADEERDVQHRHRVSGRASDDRAPSSHDRGRVIDMSDGPRTARKVFASVLGDHMTAKVWTSNYAAVLPFTPQSFAVGALLPMMLYLFRWGHRRGRGKFRVAFSAPGGRPTIRSVSARLAGDPRLEGFESNLARPCWVICS